MFDHYDAVMQNYAGCFIAGTETPNSGYSHYRKIIERPVL